MRDHQDHDHAECGEHCSHAEEGMEEFRKYIVDQGFSLEDFESMAEHEQIKLLNSFLKDGIPPREIQKQDWKAAVESILNIEPAEQLDDLFDFDDPNWSTIELPATITGQKGENFVSDLALPHIHGHRHGVDQVESMTMGVTIERAGGAGNESSDLVINFIQGWAEFSHVFCSIQLNWIKGGEDDEGYYSFSRGVFHPGYIGLIAEEETEFLGFVESFAKDACTKEDGDLLPGKWIKKRTDSIVYTPGVDESTGRATLVGKDIVIAHDYLTSQSQGAV